MDLTAARIPNLCRLGALVLGSGLALAQPSRAQPAAQAAPLTTTTVVIPKSDPSPLVQTLVGPPDAAAKPAAAVPRKLSHRRVAARRGRAYPNDPDRPPLVDIVLAAPILPPPAVPRPIVPAPAYFIDGIAALLTTPPPPVFCERRPADRNLPDPHLYREAPVACTYDLD